MSHEITPWLQLRPLTPSSSEKSTEVKVFMENGVRGRAQTAGANSHRGATKKREISCNLFSINVLLSIFGKCPTFSPHARAHDRFCPKLRLQCISDIMTTPQWQILDIQRCVKLFLPVWIFAVIALPAWASCHSLPDQPFSESLVEILATWLE